MNLQFLSSRSDHVYAVMRVIVGLMFSAHGMQKLFGWFGGAPAEMPAPMLYAAGGIELIGGVLIAIGLFTQWAAFICSGMMAVAYFMVHQSMGLLPIQNHGEMAVLY